MLFGNFIDIFVLPAYALGTLVMTILSVLGSLMSFVFALGDFVINYLPRFLVPGFGMFFSVRLFKFISKRHNSSYRG